MDPMGGVITYNNPEGSGVTTTLLRTGEGGPPSLTLFFFLKGTENGWDKMWDMVPPQTSGWKIHVYMLLLLRKRFITKLLGFLKLAA